MVQIAEHEYKELVSTLEELQAENESMSNILSGQDYLSAAMDEINHLKRIKQSLEVRVGKLSEDLARAHYALKVRTA